LGDGDDGARRADGARGSHDRRGSRRHFDAVGLEARDERLHFGSIDRLTGDKRVMEAKASRFGVPDQVQAIEQHDVALVASANRAISGNERVLTAGDAFHGSGHL
jgi:hypothetical protein